jgi:hypothetical protein
LVNQTNAHQHFNIDGQRFKKIAINFGLPEGLAFDELIAMNNRATINQMLADRMIDPDIMLPVIIIVGLQFRAVGMFKRRQQQGFSAIIQTRSEQLTFFGANQPGQVANQRRPQRIIQRRIVNALDQQINFIIIERHGFSLSGLPMLGFVGRSR